MTYIEKRRATEDEITRACEMAKLRRDDVAEVWIANDSTIEIVLRGFVDKIVVNMNLAI